MLSRLYHICWLFPIIIAGSCRPHQPADLFVFNAHIYTVDSGFSTAEAMVIKDGKILDLGKADVLERRYAAEERLDAGGAFIYPGLIDAHAHFLGFGLSLQTADLTGTESWNAVLDRMRFFARQHPLGWLTGRGWDQNDWVFKSYPNKEKLDLLFPDRPVLLRRVDGHAAIANQFALDLAGIKPGDTISGGQIETVDGKLTGILVDKAVELVLAKMPPSSAEMLCNALLGAQKKCLAAGLTTIADCGIDYDQALLMDSLQKTGDLKIRLYVMLSDAAKNFAYLKEHGKLKTPHLNLRAVKVYADGALGSRGACLLEPYSDRDGHFGALLSSHAHFDSVAAMLYDMGLQMCTHAIGDSGNRTILNTYARYLKGKNDLRWRIEHAQVVNEFDFASFGRFSIIPSVQPTHATSDMYWAGERLGAERERNAYAYKRLQQQNGWLPLGTDCPVEDISPLRTFYAAVFRKDAAGKPVDGYQPHNALSRQEALRGMTIWAARAAFEEEEKGSLEKGKLADFIVLPIDLMKAAPEEILKAHVSMTFVGGQRVY